MHPVRINLVRAILVGAGGMMPYAIGCEHHSHRRYPEERREVVRREVIYDEPPPARVEVRTIAPSHDHVWVEGYWVRRGSKWDWVPGHWEALPHRGASWEQGHWQREGRGWYWVEGRWR